MSCGLWLRIIQRGGQPLLLYRPVGARGSKSKYPMQAAGVEWRNLTTVKKKAKKKQNT